ncbi:MAG: hypothetical protein R6V67_03445 [Spirochaetia bacterium]
MTKISKLKIYAGRVGLFLGGGLLVFAIMSFSVVNKLNDQNEELTEALDTSQYEAERLLDDAKAQLENKDYDKARESLTKLFENQPGSDEAVEGKSLMLTINNTEETADEKWEDVMPGIKEQWGQALAAEMRTKLEENMDKTIDKEWEKVKPKVRNEWEIENQL